jgi:hypothetical protein
MEILEPSMSFAAPISVKRVSLQWSNMPMTGLYKSPYLNWIFVLIIVVFLAIGAAAIESGRFRLLSASDSSKLILVSQIPSKNKYILDAASAKITIDNKPAEFKDLKVYSVIELKLELRKIRRDGIEIDGSTSEIRVTIPDKPE